MLDGFRVACVTLGYGCVGHNVRANRTPAAGWLGPGWRKCTAYRQAGPRQPAVVGRRLSDWLGRARRDAGVQDLELCRKATGGAADLTTWARSQAARHMARPATEARRATVWWQRRVARESRTQAGPGGGQLILAKATCAQRHSRKNDRQVE